MGTGSGLSFSPGLGKAMRHWHIPIQRCYHSLTASPVPVCKILVPSRSFKVTSRDPQGRILVRMARRSRASQSARFTTLGRTSAKPRSLCYNCIYYFRHSFLCLRECLYRALKHVQSVSSNIVNPSNEPPFGAMRA